MKKGAAFTILSLALIVPFAGRVDRSLLVAREPALAWAQETPDSPDEIAETVEAKVPVVANNYCGQMSDAKLGNLPLHLNVKQKGNALGGTWTDNNGDAGPISGTVRKDGTVSATLKINGAACRGVFRGQWAHGPYGAGFEISGNYIWVGKACQPEDGGTFLVDTWECPN